MRSRWLFRLVAPALALGASLVVGGVAAAGVSGPAFYVDGQLYRTVGTPTDFTGTGAPQHSFDVIYDIPGQLNVAERAPGDPGYNGGRWQVHALSFADYDAAVAAHDVNGSGDFDSAEEVVAAIDDGDAVDLGVVKSFECPVIPLPKGKGK